MSSVRRRLIAVVLSIALQWGALAASLVHAHIDGHGPAHHRHSVVHVHFEGHHAEHAAETDHHQPAMRADDDPERLAYLQLFVAVHSEFQLPPAVAPNGFFVAAPREFVMQRVPEMVRSHGPPERPASDSRGPPALLS